MYNWLKIGSLKWKGGEVTGASKATDSMTTGIVGGNEISQQISASLSTGKLHTIAETLIKPRMKDVASCMLGPDMAKKIDTCSCQIAL
ncbi:hypothetical protein J437_LFUL002451 [Ladona fulva]|uniref:Uncharacterized protein n=1 Tax=Ladona fulva TaxID=123851 RepID=A0A8K0KMJ1_LADFU|nr:hypothetical protein J437_LFUL002451 [Ladona fulva]